MTNKELSAAVIKKLVDAGVPRKAFSIRTSYAGYSQSVRVYVKDLSVSVKRVEELVSGFDRVRRCHKSYEILAGGNTFVFVDYDHDTLTKAKDEYLGVADKMIEDEGRASYVLHDEDGFKVTYLFVSPGSIYNHLRLEVDGEDRVKWAAYNRYSLAEGLAVVDAVKKARSA